MDREKVIKGLQNLRDAIATDYIHDADQAVGTIDNAIALLKEQEEKPLRCDKCSFHREDGWCGMNKQWVTEQDYCSWGAWKGR